MTTEYSYIGDQVIYEYHPKFISTRTGMLNMQFYSQSRKNSIIMILILGRFLQIDSDSVRIVDPSTVNNRYSYVVVIQLKEQIHLGCSG